MLSGWQCTVAANAAADVVKLADARGFFIARDRIRDSDSKDAAIFGGIADALSEEVQEAVRTWQTKLVMTAFLPSFSRK